MANKEIRFPSRVNLEEKISAWAHDLRSPFNHVLGFTKIVLNGQSGPLSDLQKEDLKTVYHSSLRAMALVNNLIEIARLQQGLKEINNESVNLQSFLDKSLAHWKKYNPDWQIPIATMISTQNGKISLDKSHTQSILNSLLSYLATYTDGTGSILLEIAEDDLSLILKLHLTEITKMGSDEMSLEMYGAICKAYVDLLQGEICTDTVDKNETIVTITFPITPS
jgi:two-component system, cell cycle sensor histidine kinase PleC